MDDGFPFAFVEYVFLGVGGNFEQWRDGHGLFRGLAFRIAPTLGFGRWKRLDRFDDRRGFLRGGFRER